MKTFSKLEDLLTSKELESDEHSIIELSEGGIKLIEELSRDLKSMISKYSKNKYIDLSEYNKLLKGLIAVRLASKILPF